MAALPPPQRSFDIGGAAEIGGEVNDRLRCGDDLVERLIEPFDPLAGLCRGAAITAADGKTSRCCRHRQHVPPRKGVLRTHEILPRLNRGCQHYTARKGRQSPSPPRVRTACREG